MVWTLYGETMLAGSIKKTKVTTEAMSPVLIGTFRLMFELLGYYSLPYDKSV